MRFYPSLGFLVFGSRLRRLSEYFIAEVNKVYEQTGIPFDASWFPVFYLLSKCQPLSLTEIAEALEVSHSAVSQLVTSLRKKGWVSTKPSKADARRQEVMFTKKGQGLLVQLEPVWQAVTQAMETLAAEHADSQRILAAIAALEASLDDKPLAARIADQLATASPTTSTNKIIA
ncbi:DNA-binding transcriptional regulator, MarR family [Chitinophaga costaii]|uniref:DNA-binding transcriptional regulator, MarR family n=1 Tax=Chitinophaga costaii TaxID=1335309 RepID=A0A1C3Z705_9BACT|nr:MarR family winged helix-turn-helix transcriptional regulator [Chitinophaga costaii]PUZ30256.1 MarR family transcriptional regulator [Chitinophaga costaii]SCB78139.1 DNA-binding transcriptional regulator, MarR family [Chitinophaga costaii]